MESGINRSTLINCLVGKCPFSAPKGHHHERSTKRLAASEQLVVEHWLIGVEKSGKTCPRRSIQNIRAHSVDVPTVEPFSVSLPVRSYNFLISMLYKIWLNTVLRFRVTLPQLLSAFAVDAPTGTQCKKNFLSPIFSHSVSAPTLLIQQRPDQKNVPTLT